MKNLFKKSLAEFIGTLFYILIPCGTVMAVKTDFKNGAGYLISALCFGFVYAALHFCFAKISGAHFNPALTIGSLITGETKLLQGAVYILSQFAGAFGAYGLLTALFWDHQGNYAANTHYDAEPWLSLLVEFLLTFFFAFVYFVSSKKCKPISGIFTGLALSAVHFLGIQLTGAGLNPARSLVAAIFAGSDRLDGIWAFIIGPIIGSSLAALLFLVFYPSSNNEDIKKSTCNNTEVCNETVDNSEKE